MTSRPLSAFGLALLMVAPLAAQDNLSTKEKAEVKAQIQEAQELAGSDMPKAIGVLEKVLKTAPDNRNALFLMGAMSVVRGDRADEKSERIECYRRSAAAFERIEKLYKELTPNEKRFQDKSRVGRARVLAFEGKADQSFASVKTLLEQGVLDFDAVEADKDFGPVREIAEYKSMAEAHAKLRLEQARKEIAEEISTFKSFPFDFTLKSVEEKEVALADSKGKVTIVDVWGTWCPPCRMEIPHFVALSKQYKDKGLEIVGINTEQEENDAAKKKVIKAFVKETGIPYPCVLNDGKTEEKIPGFQGYPTTLFIDRSGKVRMMLVGYTEMAKLEAIVTTLLAEPSVSGATPAEAKP